MFKKLVILTLALSLIIPMTASGALKLGAHTDLSWYGNGTYKTGVMDADKNVLGLMIARSSFLWHKIEPYQGARNWAEHDATIDGYIARGIENLAVVYGSPQWANGSSDYNVVPADAAKFRTWLDNYKRFMTDAVNRYKGKVKKWELWNEQNEYYFWKPNPNPDQYITFYKEMYALIKSIDPTAEVAMGSLCGITAGCCITGVDFLKYMYNRGVYPDIVNLHPYDKNAPDIDIQWEYDFTDIGVIHDIMVQYGQGNKPIWITEWGWGSSIGGATQASYFRTAMEMLLTRYPYVTVATWFTDRDFNSSGFDHGLMTYSHQDKPVTPIFREYIAKLNSTAQPPPTEPPPTEPPPPPATSCSYGLSVTSVEYNWQKHTAYVTVSTSSSTCAWTATSNASWLTVSPASGTGRHTVTYSMTRNYGPTRVGAITIGNKILTVTQRGRR